MKLTTRLLLASLAAAILVPAGALAAKPERKKNKNEGSATTFTTLDKDSDGVVTETEYLALMKNTLGETAAKTRFGDLDKDKNGKLSKEEFEKSAEPKKKRERKKKKPAN